MRRNPLASREVAVIGWAETKMLRQSDLSGADYAGAVMEAAVAKAGIRHTDIDGLACNIGSSMRFWPNFLAENLGIESRWTQCTDVGGATALANIQRAAAAILSGQCNVALCVATPPYEEGGPSPGLPDFEHAAGYQGPASAFALLSRSYDERHGLDLKALGKLAVAQRNGAVLNDNAVESLRKPITVDDYLNSRIIADPIRLLDCVMPCKAAYATIVASTEWAKQHGIKVMAHPLAYSELVNFRPREPLADVTETGFSVVGPEVLAQAGLKPADVDMFHPYDDFMIAVMMQLEEFGFCERGQGAKFIHATDFSPTGSLPLNTGGGQISAGQPSFCGSALNLTEALRQLWGEGGARQVPNARNAVCTGIGILRNCANWGTSNAMVFERADS